MANEKGAKLPAKKVHKKFLDRLVQNERDKRARMAQNRNSLKPFKAQADKIYDEARKAGVTVAALKHAFKVELFTQDNIDNVDEKLATVEIADDFRAIGEQLDLLNPARLGGYEGDKTTDAADKAYEASRGTVKEKPAKKTKPSTAAAYALQVDEMKQKAQEEAQKAEHDRQRREDAKAFDGEG